MNWWLGSIITRFHKKFYPNFPFLLSAQVSPKECQDKGRFAPSLEYHKTQRATADALCGVSAEALFFTADRSEDSCT
jgi:hypothetical protein